MVADNPEKDDIRDLIAQQLSQTSFNCSSLVRLSGGTANFVYRGTPSSSPADSIIIKHGEDYLASNPAFKLDTERCDFEEAILQALNDCPPYSGNNITVKAPRLFYFNQENKIQVLEDLPNSVDLKSFLLSEVSHGVSQNSARSLGRALGSWLRSFHVWGEKPAQTKLRQKLGKHNYMKGLKYHVNYVGLVESIDRFPAILQGSRDVFEKVRDFAATELEEREVNEEYNIVHGDLWTGNVLIPNTSLTDGSQTTLLVVDWECAQVGVRALDLAQMIAELYETKLFRAKDAGVWIIEAFLEGYGPLSDEMAFRTAIHVGVHLISFGSTVPGWGSEQQVEEVVKVGRDLIVRGWKKDKAWFEGETLGCLFRK
ncbi:hypothetical protein MAP00_008928 [Monascus purpureus]|nr:hypothetical protein MAP00_008928 [Monascus purpureus]